MVFKEKIWINAICRTLFVSYCIYLESAKRLIKTKFKKQYTEWISTKSKDQSRENVVKHIRSYPRPP